jgi:hypothetical protein
MADAAQVFSSSSICVVDYRCTFGRADRPFPEVHRCFLLSYVRKGSFGCRTDASRDGRETGTEAAPALWLTLGKQDKNSGAHVVFE